MYIHLCIICIYRYVFAIVILVNCLTLLPTSSISPFQDPDSNQDPNLSSTHAYPTKQLFQQYYGDNICLGKYYCPNQSVELNPKTILHSPCQDCQSYCVSLKLSCRVILNIFSLHYAPVHPIFSYCVHTSFTPYLYYSISF